MKSTIMSMVAVAGLLVAGSTLAVDMPAVAKKNNCVACHKIEAKLVGPAWQDVAKKYKGDAGAAEHLKTAISKGGKGVWGPMPMPANSKVSDADLDELVTFVLGL